MSRNKPPFLLKNKTTQIWENLSVSPNGEAPFNPYSHKNLLRLTDMLCYTPLHIIQIPYIYAMPDTTPTYTKSQLALRNGQDKPEVWVAYKGVIYDVSRSRLWRNGKHYEHWAGQDLTAELPDAPHDEWVFQNLDVIGKLV